MWAFNTVCVTRGTTIQYNPNNKHKTFTSLYVNQKNWLSNWQVKYIQNTLRINDNLYKNNIKGNTMRCLVNLRSKKE